MYVSFQDICWNASSFPFPFLALAQEAQGLNSQPAAYPHSWGVRQLGDVLVQSFKRARSISIALP